MSRQLPSILLCGYERGGTTLLSQIFRENGYVGGFEVGALMCDTPKAFLSYKPYCDMLRPGWKLGNRITLKELCSADFEHFYHGLVSTAFPKKRDAPAFDKTPIYMSRLGYTLSRTSFINKAVVITRDPRAVFVSWAKRAIPEGANAKAVDRLVRSQLPQYSRRYLDYFFGSITHRSSSNVMFIAYEDLCINQVDTIKRLGSFACERDFVLTDMTHNYKNIYGNNIGTSNVAAFDQYLEAETQDLVLKATELARPFFFEDVGTKSLSTLGGWEKLENTAATTLEKFRLDATPVNIDGFYFEPETYLLRNSDVLLRAINPVDHFRRYGRREGRRPA